MSSTTRNRLLASVNGLIAPPLPHPPPPTLISCPCLFHRRPLFCGGKQDFFIYLFIRYSKDCERLPGEIYHINDRTLYPRTLRPLYSHSLDNIKTGHCIHERYKLYIRAPWTALGMALLPTDKDRERTASHDRIIHLDPAVSEASPQPWGK